MILSLPRQKYCTLSSSSSSLPMEQGRRDAFSTLNHECRNNNNNNMDQNNRHHHHHHHHHNTNVNHQYFHDHYHNIQSLSLSDTTHMQPKYLIRTRQSRHSSRRPNYYYSLYIMMTIIITVLYPSSFCYAIVASSKSLSTTATLLRQSSHQPPPPSQQQQQEYKAAMQHLQLPTTTSKRRQEQQQQQQQQERTILVVQILDAPDNDATITLDKHVKLRSVLFDGGDDASTMPSVQQQMKFCSGNAISFVPKQITDNDDDIYSFIVDIVVNPNLIIDKSNRNEWVEVMASIALDSNTGPLRNTALSNSNDNGFTLEPDDDYYYTSILRQLAQHVIILLPVSYPNTDFIATAEIDNTISIYAVSWAVSLSAYMHELAHNLGLRHSGDTLHNTDSNIDTEYGDSSGYMGQSMITPWTPQKCYNAAQHWQLGWFNSQSYRVSLSSDSEELPSPSLPLRINVAAFVEYMKLVSLVTANTEDNTYVVLVQVTSNIYLQFNGAKSYNVGTDYIYANEIVVVEQDTTDRSTRVLASLLQDESFVIANTNRIVHVCGITISGAFVDDNDVIDFATIAISDSHTANTISSVCQSGPDYQVPNTDVSSPSTTSTPTEPPTANAIVVPPPSLGPVILEPTITTDTPVIAPTMVINDSTTASPLVATITPTIQIESDSNSDNEEMLLPSSSPIVADIPDLDVNAGVDPPTSSPTPFLNLRGSDTIKADNMTTTTTNSTTGNSTPTTSSNESIENDGLSTSSIIYSVFGTVVGAIVLSSIVLFFLSRHSKPSDERRGSSTTHRRASPARSKQRQHPAGIGSSSRTMKSTDGSPTSHFSEHRRKIDGEERSKNTVPSVTTRSSSQKPKLTLPKQMQPVVTTTCFNKNNAKNPRNQVVVNHNDEDSSDDDDDKSDTLSVILQQEIWKDRVQRIMQTVFFVHDKDGTVTQMMPAAKTKDTASASQQQYQTK